MPWVVVGYATSGGNAAGKGISRPNSSRLGEGGTEESRASKRLSVYADIRNRTQRYSGRKRGGGEAPCERRQQMRANDGERRERKEKKIVTAAEAETRSRSSTQDGARHKGGWDWTSETHRNQRGEGGFEGGQGNQLYQVAKLRHRRGEGPRAVKSTGCRSHKRHATGRESAVRVRGLAAGPVGCLYVGMLEAVGTGTSMKDMYDDVRSDDGGAEYVGMYS